MPLSVVPTSVNEPQDPAGTSPETDSATSATAKIRPTPVLPEATDPEPDFNGNGSPRVRGSRWVDYDTYELLNMITELEDERRWARLREGIWIAILLHLILLSGITWIPKYIF